MKRAHILSCSLLAAAIAMVGLASIGTNPTSYFDIVNAGAVNLTLSGSNAFNNGIATIETAKNNSIRIRSTGNGLSLASGQSISNVDMIQGITSINVSLASGSATIYGDYESDLPRNRVMGNVTTSSGSVSLSQGMRYFEIVASEDAVINELTITYDCPLDIPFQMVDGILLDGIADDPVYTSSVKNSKYVLTNGDYQLEIIGAKTSTGIIIHADYYVVNTKHHDSEWWQNDNFEVRFIDNPDGKYQLWSSTLRGGERNFTRGFETGMTLENGKYHMSFEEFESYEQLSNHYGISFNSSSLIHFMAGTAWAAGWTQPEGWYNWDYIGKARDGIGWFVTEDGIIDANIRDVIDAKVSQAATQSILTNSFVVRATGWNLAGKNIALGTTDFSVVVDLDSLGGSDWARSWVADIASCNVIDGEVRDRWVHGGWSLRSDWWGWGGWNNTHADMTCGWHDEDFVRSVDYSEFKRNYHAKLCVEKNGDRIYVYGQYCDNDDSSKRNYIYYVTEPLGYSGPITLNFGATGGSDDEVTVTYNSIRLVSGTALAMA